MPGRGTLKRAIVLAAVVALAGSFAAHVGGRALGRALDGTRVWPLVVAGALQAGMLGAKALAWRILLAARHRVRWLHLVRYAIAAFAASAIAPLRAGEALRVWLLERRENVPIAAGAATAVCEKVLDTAAMFALVLPLPLVVPGLPRRLGIAIALGACGAILVVAALAILAARSAGASRLARVLAAVHALASPRRWLAAFGALVLGWLFDLAMVVLVLFAVGIALSAPEALAVLLAINLAIAVPATPAQLGAHEAGAVAGLALFHVPLDRAFAFAILYHAIQVVPLVAAGLALEWRLVVSPPARRAAP